jgi:glucan biosynthesis protein
VKRSENRVVSTRIGPDAQFAGARQFVLDFKGPKFERIPENKPPQAIVNCSGGARIADSLVLRNDFLGTWRVIIKMLPKPDSHEAVDLRCSLQQGTNVVGETWTYQWSPP